MRKTLLIALSLTLTIAMVKAQAPATIRLTDVTLMHEMREAAIPENKAVISDRNVSFQYPSPGMYGNYIPFPGTDHTFIRQCKCRVL